MPSVSNLHFNFWHSSTVALRSERQGARMSEIKNVGYTWMAKCNQLSSLRSKELVKLTRFAYDDIDFRLYELCWDISGALQTSS